VRSRRRGGDDAVFIIDDEQRRADPQPPRAQRVAAARAHLRHRRFATMAPHRFGAVAPNLNPRRSQCGRLDFYHGLLGPFTRSFRPWLAPHRVSCGYTCRRVPTLRTSQVITLPSSRTESLAGAVAAGLSLNFGQVLDSTTTRAPGCDNTTR